MEEYSLAIYVHAHWSLWFKDPTSNASQIDQKGHYLAKNNKSDTFLVSILIVLLVQNNFGFYGIKIRIKQPELSDTT